MTWRSFRSGLVKVHLWLAIVLSLPMLVIGISGSALLVQREILARSLPAASAVGERKPIPDIVAAAQKSAPAGTSAKRVDLPAAAGRPVSVRFGVREEGKPETDIYVDPVSLNVLGSEPVVERGPILAVLIGIHAFLAMPPPIGLPFVGWMGVIMTFMGLSGLVLWWPRRGEWKSAFFMRRGASGVAFHLDLHKMVGIWGLIVLLAVSTSGVYLTFPQTIGPFVQKHFPGEQVATNPLPGYTRVTGPLGPEEAIASARTAITGARIMSLELPAVENSYVAEFAPEGLSPSEPRVLVVLDSATGEITYIDDPRNYSLRDQVLNWQHLLHFGVGLGPVWMMLVFFSGLLPLLFAITGLTVWWKRRRPLSEPALKPAE
ncbi:MAG TPA: PepSY-associated TM helix domain-containing protein [Micropepsaceae bacterium]|nr:PepSY-associated TM helix domain-containing protein [Micropepsaceae bacterium]